MKLNIDQILYEMNISEEFVVLLEAENTKFSFSKRNKAGEI